jgi:hypothetical protein
MPLEGEDLGVELVELRHAGRVGLPRIAEVYVDANHRLAETADVDAAFKRTYGGFEGGPSYGTVAGPWTALRNLSQTVLGNTASNVMEAGEVLRHVADTYETCDTEAGEKLRSEWAELDQDAFVNQPPGDLPEPSLP